MEQFYTFFVSHLDEISEQTVEHLGLTVISLALAILISVPTGIFLTRKKKLSGPVIGFIGVIQTVPSIALLGLLLPLLGIGAAPAIVALFLYALLPIVRNTYTGIQEVDPAVIEAANGMGMTGVQRLVRVELPLAMPVLFAGIRTATVINVGVATLAALIAAGGLGEFIFRGISLNNTNMLLSGAIPAALLAILLDSILGLLQRFIRKIAKSVLIGFSVLIFLVGPSIFIPSLFSNEFVGGFVPEFILREDGYQGLRKRYGLALKTVEIESGLMFRALHEGEVDVISGYSTDGRIKAYDFVILEDDLGFFPPYHAAPLVRGETLRRFPELRDAYTEIAGTLDDATMAALNFEVDFEKKLPRDVAGAFLEAQGIALVADRATEPDVVIGSKNFTEQYILAHLFELLIESRTTLTVDTHIGLAGTKTCFDALMGGEIDLYPEYTGTGLLVLLQPTAFVLDSLMSDRSKLYPYVRKRMAAAFDVVWLDPLGFNNTWAMMMRREDTERLNIHSISELKGFLDRVP